MAHRENELARRQRGFTLIELVIVIAIIGILAAVALPRFISMQTQARVSKAQALFGAVRAASAIAHAGCLANVGGTCTATGGTLVMEGATINMINAYPTADVATASPGGIVLATNIVPSADGVTLSAVGTTVHIDVTGGTAPNCRISYTQAALANQAPTVALDVTGC